MPVDKLGTGPTLQRVGLQAALCLRTAPDGLSIKTRAGVGLHLGMCAGALHCYTRGKWARCAFEALRALHGDTWPSFEWVWQPPQTSGVSKMVSNVSIFASFHRPSPVPGPQRSDFRSDPAALIPT